MSETNDKCEHCGSLDTYDYCGECGEAACVSCMMKESNCEIDIRRLLLKLNAFLLDPDDITLSDLKDLSEMRLRQMLLQKGERDIDEDLLTTCANGETIAALKAYAQEYARVWQSELQARLRELTNAELVRNDNEVIDSKESA